MRYVLLGLFFTQSYESDARLGARCVLCFSLSSSLSLSLFLHCFCFFLGAHCRLFSRHLWMPSGTLLLEITYWLFALDMVTAVLMQYTPRLYYITAPILANTGIDGVC